MLLKTLWNLSEREHLPSGGPGGAAPIPGPAPAVSRPSSFPHLPHTLNSTAERPPAGGAYRTLLLPTSGMWAPLIQWAGQNSDSLIQPIGSPSANPTNPDSFMLGLSGRSWHLLWLHMVWRELALDSRTFHGPLSLLFLLLELIFSLPVAPVSSCVPLHIFA